MSDTDDPGATELDEAIGAWLRDQSPAAMRRVMDLGPPVLRRAMWLYHRVHDNQIIRQATRGVHGRDIVDGWTHLYYSLAQAYPDTYVAEIKAQRIRVPRNPRSIVREIFTRIGIDPPARRWWGLRRG